MDRYIDPTYDAGFKLMFGREKISEYFLVSLLNSIFEKDPSLGSISSVKYLNNEHQSEWIEGKGIRYDILCETAEKHRFIVEMQKASQPRFIDRAAFYVSRGIAEQGYKGKDEEEKAWDYKLKPVIGVFLCNFHVPSLEDKAVSRFRLLDEETYKPMGDLTRYIFIQLPFFNKREHQCNEMMDQWLYNIKNMGTNQEVAFMNTNEVFRRLAKVSSRASLTPAERYSYDADVKNARDMLNQLRGARQEGREEGRTEEKLFIAEKLVRIGLSDNNIVSATGLSLQQIAEIRKNTDK